MELKNESYQLKELIIIHWDEWDNSTVSEFCGLSGIQLFEGVPSYYTGSGKAISVPRDYASLALNVFDMEATVSLAHLCFGTLPPKHLV